ncbi:uncharacterized protein FTOL_12752 [Fusarium torulosum]|uniref:Uncharacterized protein n=1 Tax=Fusarium torulosum TaxID=33205 RepID=A0AAE8SP66_9HYPO|nr:uncharacterized protein FTOL_12752 [Fusarium torulosum]
MSRRESLDTTALDMANLLLVVASGEFWNQVMLSFIEAVIDDDNILQYIPKTHAIASSDCSAPREGLVALAVTEDDEANMEEELDGFTGAKRRDDPAAQPGSRRKHFYVTL